MKTVSFYISEYGYGHAARSLALIRKLLTTRKDIKIIICNSFAFGFLKDSLKEFGNRVIFHQVETDVGYVLKEHSIELDAIGLNKKCKEYLEKVPEISRKKLAFCVHLR